MESERDPKSQRETAASHSSSQVSFSGSRAGRVGGCRLVLALCRDSPADPPPYHPGLVPGPHPGPPWAAPRRVSRSVEAAVPLLAPSSSVAPALLTSSWLEASRAPRALLFFFLGGLTDLERVGRRVPGRPIASFVRTGPLENLYLLVLLCKKERGAGTGPCWTTSDCH